MNRPLLSHQQTQYDPPEHAHHAPKHDPLVHRHQREHDQADNRPELRPSPVEVHAIRAHAAHALVPALALQQAHADDEQHRVERRAHRLVEHELDRRVGDVDAAAACCRWLVLLCRCGWWRIRAWEVGLEPFLPGAVQWGVEDGICDELGDWGGVERERFLWNDY